MFGEFGELSPSKRLSHYGRTLLIDWALYDERRRLVPDGAYLQAAYGMKALAASFETAIHSGRVSHRLVGQRYFWIGVMALHFGHFLISTLSRMWALSEIDARQYKFVYAGGLPPDELFQKYEFIRESFEALGLRSNDFIQVYAPPHIPLAIEDLLVAEPSFTENFGGTDRFAETLQRIRSKLTPGVTDNRFNSPVYVSKEKVCSGIRSVVNESDVTAIIRRQSSMTVHTPDVLPFREQLRFWIEHHCVIGFESSAFHCVGFSEKKRLITVSSHTAPSMNQIAIDRLVRNVHLYLHAGANMAVLEANTSFSEVICIKDPERFADNIVELVDSFPSLVGQSFAIEPRSVCPIAMQLEPFGTNVAKTSDARQSSTGSRDGTALAAAGATSGVLTGLAQAATDIENGPWWQLDLCNTHYIYEVRVFGLRNGLEALESIPNWKISILLGDCWTDVSSYSGQLISADGPLRWQAPTSVVADAVRITLVGNGSLCLEQVEIFGEVA